MWVGRLDLGRKSAGQFNSLLARLPKRTVGSQVEGSVEVLDRLVIPGLLRQTLAEVLIGKVEKMPLAIGLDLIDCRPEHRFGLVMALDVEHGGGEANPVAMDGYSILDDPSQLERPLGHRPTVSTGCPVNLGQQPAAAQFLMLVPGLRGSSQRRLDVIDIEVGNRVRSVSQERRHRFSLEAGVGSTLVSRRVLTNDSKKYGHTVDQMYNSMQR